MKQKITKQEENDDALSHAAKAKKNQKTIRELFEGYDGPKLEEADFGKPEGREVW